MERSTNDKPSVRKFQQTSAGYVSTLILYNVSPFRLALDRLQHDNVVKLTENPFITTFIIHYLLFIKLNHHIFAGFSLGNVRILFGFLAKWIALNLMSDGRNEQFIFFTSGSYILYAKLLIQLLKTWVTDEPKLYIMFAAALQLILWVTLHPPVGAFA